MLTNDDGPLFSWFEIVRHERYPQAKTCGQTSRVTSCAVHFFLALEFAAPGMRRETGIVKPADDVVFELADELGAGFVWIGGDWFPERFFALRSCVPEQILEMLFQLRYVGSLNALGIVACLAGKGGEKGGESNVLV